MFQGDGWRMAYTPTEAPVYGGGTIVASFSDHSLLPEEAEAYFIFQGSSQRHICVGQRINPPTLEAVIPEHDKSEVVQLSICLCQNGEPSKTIATSDFLYLYDSAYYMAQFLMESVYNPNALESLEGIKSEHFDLTNEVLSTLDDRLTKAFEHLHVPDTWNLLGFPDEEPRPRETLLHFSARLGLKQFTTFLLDKPGSEDALQLPNRQNKLPRDLAQESDMEGFADLFTDYNKHDIVQWDTGRVQTQSTLFRRHEHGGATVSRNVRESMKSVDEDISLLRDFSQLMHGTVATVRHREPKPWKPDAPGIQEEGDIDDDFLQRRHYSDSQYMSSACGSSGGYPGSTVQHYSTGSTGEHMVPGASTHQRFPSVGDPPGYSPRQKILEANLRRLQDIHEGIQLLKQFNQGQMTGHEQEERRDSLNRFSTSCPSLADPEVPYKYNDHHQSMLNIGEERDDQVEEEEEEDDDEDEVDYPANDSEELSQYPSVRNSAQNHSTNTASDMRNIDEGVKIRINDVTVDSSEDNYDVLDPVMHSKDLYQETSPSAGTTGILEENTPHKNVKPKQRRWSHHVMGMSVEKQQFRNKLLAVSGKSMSLSSLDSAAEESEEEEGYIHKQLGNHKTSASLSPGSSSSLSAGTDLSGMNPRHSWAGSYTTDIIGSPEANGARNGMSPPDRPFSQGNSSIRSLTDIGLDLNSSNESQKDAMAPNQTNVSTTATSNPPMSVRTPKQKNVTLLQQSKMSVSTPSLSSVKEGEVADCRRSGTFNEGHITKEEAFTEKQSHVTIRKLVEEHDALRKSQENGMTDEESKRKARVSMIEFLNDPANFEEDEDNMEQEQKKEPKEEKKRKLSFMQKFGSHRQKRKDKEGKKTHQFVSVSFSNSTSCDICGKTLANKPAVSCENCSINVHDSSCKDSVPPCLKLKKDKRPYRREIQERCPPPGGQQGGPILKSSQSFVEAGSVPAGRVKQTSVSFSSLPNRNSSPNDQLNAGRWSSGAYSQWRRVAAKLGIDKAIAEESQESLDGASISMGQDPSTLSLQSRLRNNLEDTVSLSMESLDEGAQVEFEDDEDLMIRGPEPEAWSVYVNKKEISKLGLSKKDVKRQDHLWEIVMTEKHHLRTLKIMQRVYSHGLVHEVGLPPELVDRLFPRLEDLIDISATFLQRLQERQDEHPNKFVSQIGDLLIEQFDSPSSTRMVSAFGEFCSKKKEAEALYKDLFKQEKKFQNFIRKCSGNGLCKHHSIPDCILLVTQRLTKMPTLIEAVIKKTQETNPDHALLKKADMLARNILNAIDAQVDAKEKEQRLIEIYNKLDVRSTAVYKGKKFKKSDLLSNNRKLVYESTIAWKTARGKTIDVLIVVLSDLVFFLQENNQKYTFFTQDNKASVVSLYKLLVREKGATRDNKGVYVISQSKDTPEMYEFVCKSGEERKQMINIVSAAIRNCPEEDDDEGVPSESEEERKIREARAQKVRECLSFLQRSQDQIRELLKDRLRAVFDMFDHQPKEEHLLQPYGQDEDANPAEWIDRAAKEAERLSWLLQSGSTNLSRSVSSVGEHQSGSYTPPPVPKRSETFGGFEVSAGSVKRRPPPFPKDDDGSFSSFQSFNKDGGVDTDSAIASDTTTVSNSSSSKDPALQKLKRTSTFLSGLLPTRNAEKDDSPDVRHSDKSSDLGSISEFSISSVSLIPPVREQAACLEQILRYLAQAMHASIHQNTRLERCKAHLVESNEKVEKLTAETKQYQERKGTFRHNQQLEELRRLQSSINTERTDWEKTKERERMRLEAERETVEEHRKDIEKQQAEMEQQREELKRQRAAFQRQIDLFEQRQQQIQQEQQKEQQQLLQLQQQQQQLQKQLSSGNMIKSGLKDVNSTSVKNDKFSTTGKENNSLDPTRLSPQGLVISHRRSASADWNKDSNDKRATEGEAFEPMKEEYARSLQEPLNRKTRSDDRRISHHVFEGQNRRADTMPSLGISKRDTRENLPIHLVSATNEQKLQGAALKQQFPHKLGSSNSSPSFSGIIPKKLASSSSSSQPSSHNSQSNKSASLKHNSSGGGGMLPMKLAERSRSDSKERSQSMSSPQSAGKKDQSVIYF